MNCEPAVTEGHKREKVQRWISRLLIGDGGLEKLDDAEALQAVRGAHSAYVTSRPLRFVRLPQVRSYGLLVVSQLVL